MNVEDGKIVARSMPTNQSYWVLGRESNGQLSACLFLLPPTCQQGSKSFIADPRRFKRLNTHICRTVNNDAMTMIIAFLAAALTGCFR
jgi:hypothetical protein